MFLSTRPKKAIGSKEIWDKSEAALEDALKAIGIPYSINPGDGAFTKPSVRAMRLACNEAGPPRAEALRRLVSSQCPGASVVKTIGDLEKLAMPARKMASERSVLSTPSRRAR